MPRKIHTVLVPAGAEYKAVKRGLSKIQNAPQLVAIPAGPQGFKTFLQGWQLPDLQGKGLLLLGLGGSLSVDYAVGEAIALYKIQSATSEQIFACDAEMTKQIAQRLKIATGVGVSCDHVITSAAEKKQLGDRYGADVVDMESAVLLEAVSIAIAIVRVISDDCREDLPDIGNAIASDGSLSPIQMTFAFARKPQAAIRLIKGSLAALKELEQLTYRLF